jgi:hypothetical protein
MWIYNVGDLAANVWNTRLPYHAVLWSVKAVVIERNSNAALFLAARFRKFPHFEGQGVK